MRTAKILECANTNMTARDERVSTAPGSGVSRHTVSPVATAASERVVGMPNAAIASLTIYSRSTGPSAARPSPRRENGRRARCPLVEYRAARRSHVDHFTEQDRAAIAEPRHEIPELMRRHRRARSQAAASGGTALPANAATPSGDRELFGIKTQIARQSSFIQASIRRGSGRPATAQGRAKNPSGESCIRIVESRTVGRFERPSMTSIYRSRVGKPQSERFVPTFRIGDVTIGGRVLTAPMTGVSDLPFRRAARRGWVPPTSRPRWWRATASRAGGPTSCAVPPLATACR